MININNKKEIILKQEILHKIDLLDRKLSDLQESVARIEKRQLIKSNKQGLESYEFKAFSQWGEDGIIQFLTSELEINNKTFIEFGVEDYIEANTRFLLLNDNWSGLIIDGSAENIRKVKESELYWKHNLKAVDAFIEKENIDRILVENGLKGEIGLLSIDIDGNDYWVWQAIKSVMPAIVVVEYNSRLGCEDAITVPYDRNFVRSRAHYSMIYFGASLKALEILGEKKGYDLVGCCSAVVNAFFVRKDLRPKSIRKLNSKTAYVKSKFREARDEKGILSYLNHEEEKNILDKLKFVKIKK